MLIRVVRSYVGRGDVASGSRDRYNHRLLIDATRKMHAPEVLRPPGTVPRRRSRTALAFVRREPALPAGWVCQGLHRRLRSPPVASAGRPGSATICRVERRPGHCQSARGDRSDARGGCGLRRARRQLAALRGHRRASAAARGSRSIRGLGRAAAGPRVARARARRAGPTQRTAGRRSPQGPLAYPIQAAPAPAMRRRRARAGD